jgi:hypothetical protein
MKLKLEAFVGGKVVVVGNKLNQVAHSGTGKRYGWAKIEVAPVWLL